MNVATTAHRPSPRTKTGTIALHSEIQLSIFQSIAHRTRTVSLTMDKEKLITSVFVREAIWDKTSKNHHNSLLLTKLWKEVAVECNTTGKFEIIYHILRFLNWVITTKIFECFSNVFCFTVRSPCRCLYMFVPKR
ncbi:unnamed protein product [Callosobruchus maculatus]|uniref:MADF domain-containing protein n=1 Tax=Callosobruchus maculatus TaxID=64391 RepID=A0A653D4V4_CALMS|nr:unnamed protein product [Callosobruchus maculatus]